MSDFDNLQLRKLDGGLLLVFRELLLRRRASDVAQQLGLSQSAISHALARLRDLFGDPLFIRRSHGFEPTQRAKALGPRIEALLDMIDSTLSTDGGFDSASTRRRFGIACPPEITSLIGASLTGAFRAEAPKATFATRWAILDRAQRAVRRGEVDLALGVFGQTPVGLTAVPLYEDEYCVIARQGHPRVSGALSLAAYATVGHLFVGAPDGALGDEPPIDREIMDATYGELPGPDLIRTHGYVTQWETAMLVVSESDVLAECPRRLANRFAAKLGLQVLDPPTPPFRFKIQAVRRAEMDDPGVDWLLEKIAEAVAG